MKCELLFFYNKDEYQKGILDYIKNESSDSKIITNYIEVYDYLKTKGICSNILRNLIPNYGDKGEEVYKKSKKILEIYRTMFKELKFDEIQVFNGLDYSFLRQLMFVNSVRKILENKENIIFVFVGYAPTYPAIIEIAKKLDYEQLKIGQVKNNQIKFFNLKNKENEFNSEKFSFSKALNYVKSSSKDDTSLNKIKNTSKFISSVIQISLKQLEQKYLFNSNKNPKLHILEKVNKKFKVNVQDFDIKFVLFITATRLDLSLRPWKPVLEIFKEKKIPYIIVTGDLTTSLELSKQNIPHVSLFEEIRLLANSIRNPKEENNLNAVIDSILNTNQPEYYREFFIDLKEKIFRAWSTSIIINYILKQSPDLISVLVGADGEMLENIASECSKIKKIHSYSIVHGIANSQPIFADWFHAKQIFINGEHGEKLLIGLGYDKDRLIPTGNPKYDYLKKIDFKNCKKKLEKEYGISSEKKLIVIGMSFWHENDEKWISKLIEYSNNKNFEIVIKLHPKFKMSFRKLNAYKIDFINNKCREMKYLISSDIELTSLLASADLFITDYSSIGLEAILLEKPMITVNFQKESLGNFPNYHDEGASIYIEDYELLIQTIGDILHGKKFEKDLQEGRNRIKNKYNYYNDGKAAERIYKILCSIE